MRRERRFFKAQRTSTGGREVIFWISCKNSAESETRHLMQVDSASVVMLHDAITRTVMEESHSHPPCIQDVHLNHKKPQPILTPNKKPDSPKKHTKSAINPEMEPTQRKPPLGDIYCPPRQILNEENDYFYKVGLVVLIRGSPSPALPRLITDKLIAEHGGHQTDYVVSQATITPYVINCSITRLRDATVQRGIYSIPQAGVQFTIHEWQPRFGMGYDSFTHQVWVRITGLPLQAWTATKITAIIRNFEYSIQILPFGQAAGHYKDITALVATKSPTLIPLAYTYQEGTYASRIDISILSWRSWEEGYFPPSEDHVTHEDRLSQARTYEDPTHPRHHFSPSKFSEGALSEPTIDLSAWSPRSYQLTPPFL